MTSFTAHQYWDLRFAPETSPRAEWQDRLPTPSRARCAARWSATCPSALSSAAARLLGDRRGDVEGGKRRVSTYTVGFDQEDLRYEIVPDDLVHARRVAALFETDYFEHILEPTCSSCCRRRSGTSRSRSPTLPRSPPT